MFESRNWRQGPQQGLITSLGLVGDPLYWRYSVEMDWPTFVPICDILLDFFVYLPRTFFSMYPPVYFVIQTSVTLFRLKSPSLTNLLAQGIKPNKQNNFRLSTYGIFLIQSDLSIGSSSCCTCAIVGSGVALAQSGQLIPSLFHCVYSTTASIKNPIFVL